MTNLDALLFDLDDTLVTYGGDERQHMADLCAALALTAHEARALAKALPPAFKGALVPDSATVLESTLDALAIPARVDVAACANYFRTRYCHDVRPLIGALELLTALSGKLPLGIVTNGPADMQFEEAEITRVRRHVQAFVTSGEVGVKKPDPAIFLIACQRLGVQPERTLMVGNNPVSDVEGARGAGLRALLIGPRPAGPGVSRVRDLQALRDLILP
jgi:putative hydrolase of the HAD superfamily